MPVNSSKKATDSKELPAPQDWLDLYGDTLYLYAYSRLRDRTLCEDLVQDTLVSALAAWKSFKAKSSVQTWLISILKNKIVDYVRKASRQREDLSYQELPSLELSEFSKLGIWKVYVPNWGGCPEKTLESQEFIKALQNCFSKLPDTYQQVFQLKHMQGLERKEICKVVGISSSNFWVVLHRGRMALRKCLEGEWNMEIDAE